MYIGLESPVGDSSGKFLQPEMNVNEREYCWATFPFIHGF